MESDFLGSFPRHYVSSVAEKMTEGRGRDDSGRTNENILPLFQMWSTDLNLTLLLDVGVMPGRRAVADLAQHSLEIIFY